MKTKYEIKKSRIGPGSKLFGCSGRELKAHIQNQFAKGMNWQNYGTWHVDHIKPVKKFDLRIEKERQKCFHYSNLQPLWAKENMRKGAK